MRMARNHKITLIDAFFFFFLLSGKQKHPLVNVNCHEKTMSMAAAIL